MKTEVQIILAVGVGMLAATLAHQPLVRQQRQATQTALASWGASDQRAWRAQQDAERAEQAAWELAQKQLSLDGCHLRTRIAAMDQAVCAVRLARATR